MSDQAPVPSSVDLDRVEISVPLRTEYFATLRTLAAALGADTGFSIDEIDDLRLAISEVVASLLDAHEASEASDRVDAMFEIGRDRVIVSISRRSGGGPVVLDELATSILESVVDDHQVLDGTVRLVKRAAETTEATPPT